MMLVVSETMLRVRRLHLPPLCQRPAVLSLWEESGRTGKQRVVASLNTGEFKQRGRNRGGMGEESVGKKHREATRREN